MKENKITKEPLTTRESKVSKEKNLKKRIHKLEKKIDKLTLKLEDYRAKNIHFDQVIKDLKKELDTREEVFSRIQPLISDISKNMLSVVKELHEHDEKIEMLSQDIEKITFPNSSARESIDEDDDEDILFSDDPLYQGKKFNNPYDPDDEDIIDEEDEKENIDYSRRIKIMDIIDKLYESEMNLRKCTIRNIDGLLLLPSSNDEDNSNILSELGLKQYYLTGRKGYPTTIFDGKPDDSYHIYGYFFTFRDDVVSCNRNDSDHAERCRLFSTKRIKNVDIGEVIKSGSFGAGANIPKIKFIEYLTKMKREGNKPLENEE